MSINYDNVSTEYQLGPIRSPLVLKDVSASIQEGKVTAVIGHTGSGKSSLLKTLNGLLLPTTGQITIDNIEITANINKKTLKSIRKLVGMVFQFPEDQLFAETVFDDIVFGPLNFGIPRDEANQKVREVAKQLGIHESTLEKSPFSLSGGQKRRAAIAGVLVTDPDILVLDEPGAGLDPNGKKTILQLIFNWHHQKKKTTLFVTHDMEDVVTFADEVIVMHEAKLVYQGSMIELFSDHSAIEKWGLDLPEARRFQLEFEKRSGLKLSSTCLTIEDLVHSMKELDL